ncbi:hypothetical protein LguiA_024860 [Lonicera macranthoides]
MPHQVYVVSYNAAYPSMGPSYYVPPSPYTYTRAQPDVFPVQFTPLDSLEILMTDANTQIGAHYGDLIAGRQILQ